MLYRASRCAHSLGDSRASVLIVLRYFQSSSYSARFSSLDIRSNISLSSPNPMTDLIIFGEDSNDGAVGLKTISRGEIRLREGPTYPAWIASVGCCTRWSVHS